jgi:hypothetical protein
MKLEQDMHHENSASIGIQQRHAERTCSTDMQHGHAARKFSMEMQHGHVAWVCRKTRSMNMHGKAARTCSIDMNGPSTRKMDMKQEYAAWSCSMDKQHI